MQPIKLLGFAGSLRKDSFNKSALKAAQQLVPGGVTLELFDLAPIPFFNEDVEAEGIPAAVREFRERIAVADGLLIATPEYNYSYSPIVKNALDWASRDDKEPFDSPLRGKVAGLISASSGYFGGTRAQHHLRQVAIRLDLIIPNTPEVFITNADKKFDEAGNLNDARTQRSLTNLLATLAEQIRNQKK